jgi:hypothetical protein
LIQKAQAIAATSVCALFLAAGLNAEATDLTVVWQVTSGKQPPTTSTLYLSSAKVRSAQDKADSIFDVTTGKMTTIDHQKKQYWETSMEELDAMLKQADEQMKKMNEQMANMPPAMREKMAGMMGGGGAPAVTVTKGAKARVIAGHSCDQYTIKSGDVYSAEHWIAKDVQVPTQYWSMQRAQFANNPMLKSFSQVSEELKKLKGFTLSQTVNVKGPMGMSLSTTTEAVEVKEGAIPAATFDVPAGYKKVDSPFAKMLKR